MKCPLYYAQLREQRNGLISDRGNCLEKECAVWDKDLECCAVVTIALEVNTMIKVLQGIKSNMPKDLAPRG